MSKRTTVCFTGMEAAEHERLTALFNEANRRVGNAWSIAPENEAQMLVIDVDSLYGHMSWLKVHNSGRTVVALSSSAKADADYVLPRPVTLEALSALLAEHGDGEARPSGAPLQRVDVVDAAPEPIAPVVAPRRAVVEPIRPAPPRRVSTEQPAVPAPAVEPAAAIAVAPAPADAIQPSAIREPAPAESPVPAAVPSSAAKTAPQPAVVVAPPAPEPRLADYLQPGALPGAVKLVRGEAPMLVLDPTARVYFGGSGLKEFLVYTREPIPPSAWTVVPPSELAKLRQELGGAQPFARLLWLAALTTGAGELAPGLDPNAKYRLSKWPQIEREFPKHFRIATTMMKGLLTVADIAQQSGASAPDVADFINASLATGFAETDTLPEGGDPAAVARGGLFGRLRGGR